jgi:CBS domain-containing protein
MNWNASSIDNLRRVFTEGFSARDISEPLISFDHSTPAAEALDVMKAQDFDVAGVRRGGLVVGYLERTHLGVGACGEHLRLIDESAVISDSAPLADVVLGLKGSPRLFVQILGAVSGIVTMSDLQKAPVRMWLFGMITLVEMRMGRLVEQLCEGESWRQFLSEGRLQKAEALLEDRRRRSQNLRLADCLQFSDKVQVIAQNEAIRSLTRFPSRRQVERACRALENLRNNLAHSQDIISCDWETIVMLATDLDGVIGGTSQVREAIAGTLSRPSAGEDTV